MTHLPKGDPALPSLHWSGDLEDFRRRLHEYVRLRGFRVWSDEAELRPAVEQIVAAHPKEAEAIRRG